jgi:hypothetical protein
MASQPSSAEQAALDYIARGWSVIPVRPRDKRPLVAWQAYQTQAASADVVRAWFAHWPRANVGLVTGRISRLVVLDIDTTHGGDASLRHLESVHGALTPTVAAITGGGGHHLYFAHPGGFVHNKTGLVRGVDVRGDGGYVVAPPSVHASGRPYAWMPSRSPRECALAPLPAWVRALMHPAGERVGHPLRYWRALVKEGVAEGERNNAIASLAGLLLWHGLDAHVTLDLLLAWNAQRCHPPLADEEVVRTVQSIVRVIARHEEQEEQPSWHEP